MTAAVVLHPHPDLGGDQHNHVVTAAYQHLRAAGIDAYRFDFDSAELDRAHGQTTDMIETHADGERSVLLVGYSFGGAVGATVTHPAVIGWSLVAPALTLFAPAIGTDPRPKQVIAAERDAWFGPGMLAGCTAGWSALEIATVAGADHFFGGAAAEIVADIVVHWAGRILQT